MATVQVATGIGVSASATVLGIDAHPVRVEVAVANGLPAFTMVGLPDAAVSEARERVRAAISAAGEGWPLQRIVVNLSPAHLRKVGTGFDLAIAVALLVAVGRIPPAAVVGVGILGELSLDGRVRGVRGTLAAVDAMKACRWVLVPVANAAEAGLVEGPTVLAVDHLSRAIGVLADGAEPVPLCLARTPDAVIVDDLADVRGNELAKRSLEIAAAGGHNLLMTGAPGAGKTMLARRLPGILPPLSPREAVEVTRIHSVAGLLEDGAGLVRARPFRAPHHSVTTPGLVGGGGASPIPGEVSLAHRGILFLDELGEFSRHAVQALRQPMEEGVVSVVRARWSVTFPARAMIIAATNPCPCGYAGIENRACRCKPHRLDSYAERLSGPVMDRIDLQVGVPPASGDELFGPGSGERSAVIAERVAAARATARARWGARGFETNAELPAADIVDEARVEADAQRTLSRAVDDDGLTGRAAHRVIRVARTIADLADDATVTDRAVREALTLRVTGDKDG